MDPIKKTRKTISEFKSKYDTQLEQIFRLSQKVIDACEKIQNSWSGSFAGWHGRMYFKDFRIPSIHEKFSGEWGDIHGIPDGWEEKQAEEVCAKIEELVDNKFLMNKFEKDINELRKGIKKFHTEVNIIFSSFNFDKNLLKEKNLFDQIETFKFGKTKAFFIKNEIPGTIMTRDTEAMRQGICMAAWLYYEGVAFEGKSIYKSVNNFLDLLDRLIRQLEIKLSFNNKNQDFSHYSIIFSDFLLNKVKKQDRKISILGYEANFNWQAGCWNGCGILMRIILERILDKKDIKIKQIEGLEKKINYCLLNKIFGKSLLGALKKLQHSTKITGDIVAHDSNILLGKEDIELAIVPLNMIIKDVFGL